LEGLLGFLVLRLIFIPVMAIIALEMVLRGLGIAPI